MANPKRGELAVKFDGKTINLALTFNALCELEEHFGENIVKLMTRMNDETKLSFREVREFMHVVLMQKVPDATIAQAGEMVEENGLEIYGKVMERCRVLSDAADQPGKATPERVPAK